MAHERNFYIKLWDNGDRTREGHPIRQFRERARVPRSWDTDKIECVMRMALNEALEKDDFVENRNEGEKLCKIAFPGLNVVYAVLEPGHPEGQFKYLIHTVVTQEMYHQWSREGRIGTLGERISEEDETKIREAIERHEPVRVTMEEKKDEEEDMFLIERKGCQPVKVLESKVSEQVLALLQKGVALSDIKVYKPIEFKLSVEIGGST